MVVQAGEDGAEGVVVQRLRRRLGPAAAAAAVAPLRVEASAPAPTAAHLHVSLPQNRLVKGAPLLLVG